MLIEILKHTPFWVWGLFAVLLYLGYFQSSPHTLIRRRVAILPLAFIGYSAFGIWSAFGASAVAVATWACGVVAALAANRLLMLPREVAYDPATGRFSLPGSFGPLLLMMSLFAAKYAVAVAMAIDHALVDSLTFTAATSLVYGFLGGAFLARSLRILSAAQGGNGNGGKDGNALQAQARAGQLAN